MSYNFGEKVQEFHAKAGGNIPVVQTPKYKMAKQKAIEMIDCGKYGLEEGDFWILMNATKNYDKMMYTGLILSHNGCLKINDSMEADKRFKPSCVKEDKEGYNQSLVFSYCNDEQGLYEVGEASKANCTNAYPYAMAYKRLFDRVVLKLSKLAFSGIYSDSESEEFAEPDEHKVAEASETKPKKAVQKKDESEEKFDASIKYASKEQVSYLEQAYGGRLGEFLQKAGVSDIKLLPFDVAEGAVAKLKDYYAKKNEQKGA